MADQVRNVEHKFYTYDAFIDVKLNLLKDTVTVNIWDCKKEQQTSAELTKFDVETLIWMLESITLYTTKSEFDADV